MRRVVLALLGALAVAGSATAQEKIRVVGQVLGTDGQSVAGARIGPSGRWYTRFVRPEVSGGVTADAAGRFETELEAREGVTLLVTDAAGSRGAFYRVKREQSGQPITISIAPMRKVRVTAQQPLRNPLPTFDFLLDLPGEGYLLNGELPSDLTFWLPPGKYKFALGSKELQGGGSQTFDLSGGSSTFDLKPVRLERTTIARNYGKPAMPLMVTDARGVAKERTLESLRGKWVILEFLGFW